MNLQKLNLLVKGTQKIKQLEPIRGSYYHIVLQREDVLNFPRGKSTRLICELDGKLYFQCGLSHVGDGNFFIITSLDRLKEIDKGLGLEVDYKIYEDPNPLGVDTPEVLKVLLEQDESLANIYNGLTDGKKRSVIFGMIKIKNIDKQVAKAIKLIESYKK